MSTFPDEDDGPEEIGPADRDDVPGDADTNLILDYLSNRLDPEQVRRLEARVKADKDFLGRAHSAP
jgi:hypothetical protein